MSEFVDVVPGNLFLIHNKGYNIEYMILCERVVLCYLHIDYQLINCNYMINKTTLVQYNFCNEESRHKCPDYSTHCHVVYIVWLRSQQYIV